MNDLPGRGDVNPYGIPVPNPHEREGPDADGQCVVCGEPIYFYEQRADDRPSPTRCQRCNDSMEYDRLERESGRWAEHPEGMELVQRLNAEAERKAIVDAGQLELL